MALLMPMMSYNYHIWVGRSPARLISFFRPSVENFSGDPPLDIPGTLEMVGHRKSEGERRRAMIIVV